MIRKAVTGIAICLLLCTGMPGGAAGGAETQVQEVRVSVDDVIKMHQIGLSDELIRLTISSSGTVFHLRPEEVIKLKSAGISEKLIKYMLTTAEARAATAVEAESGQPERAAAAPPPRFRSLNDWTAPGQTQTGGDYRPVREEQPQQPAIRQPQRPQQQQVVYIITPACGTRAKWYDGLGYIPVEGGRMFIYPGTATVIGCPRPTGSFGASFYRVYIPSHATFCTAPNYIYYSTGGLQLSYQR